jgi:tRNA U34 2-thiouridine synthase MnmA/TrmU
MNKQKILMGGILTLFIFSWGIPKSYAEPTATELSSKLVDRINKHKIRKVAAQHLKVTEEKKRHDIYFNTDGKPKGYNANGYTGVGKSGNKGAN